MYNQRVLLVMPLSTLDWGSLNTGGVDSVCQMMVEQLIHQSCDKFSYRVLAIDPLNKHVYTGKPISVAKNIEIVWIPKRGRIFGFIPAPGFMYQAYRVRQQVLDFKPNIVNTHLWSCLIGFSRKIPSIVTLHSYKWIARRKVSALNDWFYVKALPQLTRLFGHKIICVGEQLKEVVRLDVKQEVRVIGNPIDKSYFEEISRKSFRTPLKLVTCALLTPRKQIEKIISLTHILNEEGVSAELTVIGPSSDQEYVKSLDVQVKRLNMINKVKFLGCLNRSEIIAQYKNSDIGVFFSKEETFGLAPLEMMATGLPLLTTEVGILAERKSFFENIGATFVDVENPNNMLRVALQLINKPHAPKVEILQESFSVASVVSKYESLYQELLM